MENKYEIKKIEKKIERLEKNLEDSKSYVKKGENIYGDWSTDWKGKSGHPSWVKNIVIKCKEYSIKAWHRVIDDLEKKEKDKQLSQRRVK